MEPNAGKGPNGKTVASGNILTAAYAADGKTSKAKKPRKRKNGDIDDLPLVVVEPPSSTTAVDPSAAPKGKRKKKVPECPNPLFLGWLEEWKSEARAKENTNLSYVYSKAVKSLKKYPAVMDSGQACAILENFGPKICKMLDERLTEHRAWLAENEEREVPVVSNGPSTSGASYLSAFAGSSVGPSSSAVTSSSSSSSVASSSSSVALSSSSSSSRAVASSHVPAAAPSPATAPAVKKARRESSTPRNRDYIPVRRSGAYALLVALHRALPSRPFLSKKQLMAEAEPHCDASFQKTDPDSFYSAWSSMKTLLSKELVKRESCPAKFSLTETGVSLALRLASADETFSSQKDGIPSLSPEDDAAAAVVVATLANGTGGASSGHDGDGRKCHEISRLISSDEDDHPPPPSLSSVPTSSSNRASVVAPTSSSPARAARFIDPSSSSSSSSGPFPFIYLDYDHNEVTDKDSAAVTFDSVVQAGFLIKCRRRDLNASELRHSLFEDDGRRRSLSGGSGDWVLVYLANDDCPETAPGLGKFVDMGDAVLNTTRDCRDVARNGDDSRSPSLLYPVRKKKKKKRKVSGNLSINVSFEDVLMDSGDELPSTTSPKNRTTESNAFPSSLPAVADSQPHLDPTLSTSGGSDPLSAKPSSSTAPVATNHAKEQPALKKLKGHQRRKSVQDALEVMVASPKSNRKTTIPPLFTLRPGTFQVYLIVDVAEVSGGPSSGSMRKDATVPELNRNGVAHMTRRLAVGDFVWVARENVTPHREVVLDFIVERKRMDDLASSIIDGRFREQKYRLKQSGLGHVVYLIEEYGHKTFGNGTLPEASLRQAISNVQIIDDFHVVHCKDPKDVVGYLSLMTQYLRSLYANKTLHAVPHATFAADAAKLKLDDAAQHVFTFEEFGRVAEKNKDLSVRELFAKQLMVLAGISADRSYSIVERFPTPEILMRKYDELGSVKEREEMLKDLKCGLTQRKLGLAISKMLSQLYCQTGSLK